MDSELKPGSNGIFTVAVDDRVVAQKTASGFPTEEEIVNAVAKALGR